MSTMTREEQHCIFVVHKRGSPLHAKLFNDTLNEADTLLLAAGKAGRMGQNEWLELLGNIHAYLNRRKGKE